MYKLFPILDTMLALYEMPAGPARFEKYLSLLQGGVKGDLLLPIGNYNPMAKPFIIDYIQQLQSISAEKAIEQCLQSLNIRTAQDVTVVLNIADDKKGGWTNRYATDYTGRFGTSALLKRNFCTPILWTSEMPDLDTILHITEQAVLRFQFQREKGIPQTLQEHINQELFVFKKQMPAVAIPEKLHEFLEKEALTEDYNLIFAFLYGEDATNSLGMPTLGLEKGFFYYLNH